jgi:Cell division protein CrgA
MATKAKAGPGKAQKKGRSAGGRTTEASKSVQSNRYTPPIPKNVKTSPRWMGFTIIALFLVGVLVVILNYADLLPGGVNNLWLVAAIAAIFAGLILATRYH